MCATSWLCWKETRLPKARNALERHVYELKKVQIRVQCRKCESAAVLVPGGDLPNQCPNFRCEAKWDTGPARNFLLAVRHVVEDKEPRVEFLVEGVGP